MGDYIVGGELFHYGVKGMKWGQRKKDDYSKRLARGHAGPGGYLTKKRQLAGDKRDLEGLKKGQHLSIGLTKKRQAQFDARDKTALEKRISENGMDRAAKKAQKKARKEAIKSTTKMLNDKASFSEKLLYNKATRKQAAKFIVDKNMSVAEATKKSKRIAWTNTAAILGVIGAVSAAKLYSGR